MSADNFSRRRFLQTALYTGILSGVSATPRLVPSAMANPSPLLNPLLCNMFLSGGPDMRHLVVPAYDETPNSFGQKYWANRGRAHRLNGSFTAQDRWEQDYFHITVGGSGWNSGLVDIAGLNSGVTFGIWKEAGWLIEQFQAGNVAMIFNAVGGTNRAHDLSSLQMHQGDVLTSLNNQDRSGWGGRLARSAGGKSISLTRTPSAFLFGPRGAAPNYNPNAIDNIDLISVENAREMGLFDGSPTSNPHYDSDDRMARAAKSYYAALREERIPVAYDKFMDHEFKVRGFGEAIQARLENIPIPDQIRALYSDVDGYNPGNDNNGNPSLGRRILRRTDFGRQIRNLHDIIKLNDLSVTVGSETLTLDPRVCSMSYGGWDSHGDQRQVPNTLATDLHNPYVNRGIENGLKDIFGGPIGNSGQHANAPLGGFAALWSSLSNNDRSKLVLTIAGEFGRQIRDNGGNGTDHGKGNLMLVIGDNCNGGLYGDMFPDSEIVKYDEPPNRTPDIDPRTEFDHFFGEVCDWVMPGSKTQVFPRLRAGYPDEPPIIEVNNMFSNLLV